MPLVVTRRRTGPSSGGRPRTTLRILKIGLIALALNVILNSRDIAMIWNSSGTLPLTGDGIGIKDGTIESKDSEEAAPSNIRGTNNSYRIPIVQNNSYDDNKNYTNPAQLSPVQPFVPWKLRRTEPIPCKIETRNSTGSDSWTPFGDLDQNFPTDSGLWYIKIEKAASTTLSSVAVRTAIALAERTTNANNTTREDGTTTPAHHKICKFRGIAHLWAKRARAHTTRDHGNTFLWTFVKEPTKLHLSFYFFFVIDWSLGKRKFGSDTFFNYFGDPDRGIFQSQYLSKIPDRMLHRIRNSEEEIQAFVRNVIDDLDFIGTVERMDESLVLLSIMLDLEVTDVLYTNAKESGTYMIPAQSEQCHKLGGKRPLLPEMQEFLDSSYWSNLMRLENALYEAVDRSLDATIEEVVGREIFDAKLKEFLAAKETLSEHCRGKIVMACTPEGETVPKANQSHCYSGDTGCGHECLDELYPIVPNDDNESIPLY
jgi:hypothetical protein